MELQLTFVQCRARVSHATDHIISTSIMRFIAVSSVNKTIYLLYLRANPPTVSLSQLFKTFFLNEKCIEQKYSNDNDGYVKINYCTRGSLYQSRKGLFHGKINACSKTGF